MNDLAFCSLRHNTLRYARGVILILPLLFVGCFDTQSGTKGKTQKAGIAAISRFFAFNQEPSVEKAKEAGISAESLAIAGDISESSDLAQKAAELGIAVPSFIESNRAHFNNAYKIGNSPTTDSGDHARRRSSSNESAEAILNASFNQLFASVFGSARKDEPANPFTEARQKQESASSEINEDSSESKSKPTKQAGSSKPESADPVGAGIPANRRFLIVGDFDGSGMLELAYAERLSATRFVTDDGEWDFNLFINRAALEQQRAFCVDDINGDGNSDLLVTSQAWLFGSVLLGDGHGRYQYFDSFVTGYEPMVPAPGPFHGDMREILTVNMRSGALKTFRSAEHYRSYQTARLPFVPNYLLHMIAPDSSLDYLLVAQERGAEQIYEWSIDGALKPIADGLGADPTVLSSDLGSHSLQAYQVGSYASIVLTNGGASFNVVNMRVHPHIFIIIGDLQQEGFKDVAVASLMQFTPKKNN
jgi:hypothetical protein